MRLLEVKRAVDAAFERYGNIDCFMDVDPNGDDIFYIEGIYIDIGSENNDNALMLSAYALIPKLTIVK